MAARAGAVRRWLRRTTDEALTMSLRIQDPAYTDEVRRIFESAAFIADLVAKQMVTLAVVTLAA